MIISHDLRLPFVFGNSVMVAGKRGKVVALAQIICVFRNMFLGKYLGNSRISQSPVLLLVLFE